MLKPNREGGGNNIYGDQIHKILEDIGDQEAKSFVLMKRVPKDIRKSVVINKDQIKMIDTISEFGQFGSILIKEGKLVENKVGGVSH